MATRKLHRNVVALGLVSLLTDLSSEMIYPLLPVFLTVTLAAGPAALGLIEGVAETTAGLLKLFSGPRRAGGKGVRAATGDGPPRGGARARGGVPPPGGRDLPSFRLPPVDRARPGRRRRPRAPGPCRPRRRGTAPRG